MTVWSGTATASGEKSAAITTSPWHCPNRTIFLGWEKSATTRSGLAQFFRQCLPGVTTVGTTTHRPWGGFITTLPGSPLIQTAITRPKPQNFFRIGLAGSSLVPSWVYLTLHWIGSGGIHFGGTAPLLATYQCAGSGSILFAGSAPGEQTTSMQFTGSGVIQYSGAANNTFIYKYSGSGPIVFTGAAFWIQSFQGKGTIRFGGAAKLSYTESGSGALDFGGSARYKAGYSIKPTGGIAYSGGAPSLPIFIYNSSGAIAFAVSSVDQATYIIFPTGGQFDNEFSHAFQVGGWVDTGMVFNGSAPYRATESFQELGSGEMDFTGSARYRPTYNALMSGGLNYNGQTEYTPAYKIKPTGGLIYSGHGPYTPAYDITGSGGVTFTGEAKAHWGDHYDELGSGEMDFTGATVLHVHYLPTGEGLISFGGIAPATSNRIYTGSGFELFGGFAPFVCNDNYVVVGHGLMTFGGTYKQGYNFGGSAAYRPDYDVAPQGGITYVGTANVATILHYCNVGSGQLIFTGTAPHVLRIVTVFTGKGSIRFGGSPIIQASYIFKPLWIADGEFNDAFDDEFYKGHYSDGAILFGGTGEHAIPQWCGQLLTFSAWGCDIYTYPTTDADLYTYPATEADIDTDTMLEADLLSYLMIDGKSVIELCEA